MHGGLHTAYRRIFVFEFVHCNISFRFQKEDVVLIYVFVRKIAYGRGDNVAVCFLFDLG